MIKQFQFGDDVRTSIRKGAELVAKAVAVTLGPKGRNVIIERQYQMPHVTKDGVTVAQNCFVKDRFEALGTDLIREAAQKTNDLAGDGTTTSVVLAAAFYREGVKLIAAGHNPMDIKRDIDYGVAKAVEKLKAMSKPVSTDEEIRQVATISANGDQEIGNLILEAVSKIGKDGIITVEDSKTTKTEVEVVNGLQIRKGWLTPHFITDPARNEAVLDDAYVLVADMTITVIKDIESLLTQIVREGKSIVIFSKKVEGEALQLLVVNKLQGKLKCAVVELPGMGDVMHETADDIATVVGANVIKTETGRLLDKTELKDLGFAKRIVIGKENTVIVEGKGEKSAIDGVVTFLKQRIDETKHEMAKERIKERIARLQNGIAIIRCGASTESEAKEKKDRIIDAVSATRAAIDEGIVLGGGIALIEASYYEEMSNTIVSKVCAEPLRQIVENAGKNGDLVVQKVISMDEGIGYNAKENTYVDMFAAGIIDPVKVTRLALQHAASVAGLLLTTEASITDEPKEEKK